ncbi:hypothetical protein ACHAWF_004758 [Thalassiosira exigua]
MFHTAASELSSALSKVVNLYARGGFTMCTVLVDMTFNKLVDKVPLLEIKSTATCEYMEDVERGIGVIKELFVAIFWLRGFPVKKCISQRYLPREIVTGRVVDFAKYCKGCFGDYVEPGLVRHRIHALVGARPNDAPELYHGCGLVSRSGTLQHVAMISLLCLRRGISQAGQKDGAVPRLQR